MARLFLISIIMFGAILSVSTVGMHKVGAEDSNNKYQRQSSIYDKSIYRMGNRVVVDDLVNGDLYCFANSVVIDAVINGDVLCAGNIVTIGGTINNDVRVFAKQVNITANVNGNITVVGDDVRIANNATIGNDATIIAKDINIEGAILRDATIRAESVELSGSVKRNLESYHSSMTLTPSAKVGNISYVAPNHLSVPQGAVEGTVTKLSTKTPSLANSLVVNSVFLTVVLYVAWYVSLIITALGVAFLFPKSLDDSVSYAKNQPWVTALAGLVATLLAPLAVFMLAISVIGIPLALIIGFLSGAVFLLSTPFVAHLIGSQFFPKRSHPVRSLLGTTILLLLFVIPVIGMVTITAVTIFGIGLVVRVATERYAVATIQYKAKRILN